MGIVTQRGMASSALSRRDENGAFGHSRTAGRLLAVFIVVALAAYGACLSAQPLKASIRTVSGTLAAKIVANQWNDRLLSKLAMAKDMRKGTLRISVHIGSSGGYNCINCSFLVRLFDRNGNYLAHFETEKLFRLLGTEISRGKQVGSIQLEFSVNMRDLRDAEMAEFGIAPS